MRISPSLCLISLIFILASVRGVFVYHLGFPANITYAVTAIMLLGYGTLSLFKMHNTTPNGELVFLKNAVKLNFIFGVFYTISIVLLVGKVDIGRLYGFSIYPVIFALIRFKGNWLDNLVNAITVVTVVGVVLFFKLGVTGGFDAIEAANLTLRPSEFNYSRIGENLLPAGYQGDHHDAANILVMCDVFLLTKFILCKFRFYKYLYFALYLFVLFVTIITGSSANIIILIAVSALTFGLLLKRYSFLIFVYPVIAFVFTLLIIDNISDYFYFLTHISQKQSDLAGGGMFNSLDLNSLFLSIHSILFGFGNVLEVPLRYTEISFLKILISVGIMPFLIQMFIGFSPFYYLLVFRINCKTISSVLMRDKRIMAVNHFKKTEADLKFRLTIAAMPTLSGMLTLLHYGSLLRVTSIGLFCLLLAIYFKEYLRVRQLIIENSGA